MSMEATLELDHPDRPTHLPTTRASNTPSPSLALPVLRLAQDDAIMSCPDELDTCWPVSRPEPLLLPHPEDLCSSDGCSQPSSPAVFSDIDDKASSQASVRSCSSNSNHVLPSGWSWDPLQHNSSSIDMGAPGVDISRQTWCSSADLLSNYSIASANDYHTLDTPQAGYHPYPHTGTPTHWTSNSHSFQIANQRLASPIPSTTQSHICPFQGEATEEVRPFLPLSLTPEAYNLNDYPTLEHGRGSVSAPSATSNSTYQYSIDDCAPRLTTDSPRIPLESETSTTLSVTNAGHQVPYAQWLYKAFISHPRNAMTLQEIYQWFRENTDKDKNGTKGWQNSIRHNLSMNGAFKRREKEIMEDEEAAEEVFDKHDAEGSSKSKFSSKAKPTMEWYLTEEAWHRGVVCTTRFRDGKKRGTPHADLRRRLPTAEQLAAKTPHPSLGRNWRARATGIGQRLPDIRAAARRRTKQMSRAERLPPSAVKAYSLEDNSCLDVTSYPNTLDYGWEYGASGFPDQGSYPSPVGKGATGHAHMQSVGGDSNATDPAHSLHPLFAPESFGGPTITSEIDEPKTPSSAHGLEELDVFAIKAEKTISPTCSPRDIENRRDGHITHDFPCQASTYISGLNGSYGGQDNLSSHEMG